MAVQQAIKNIVFDVGRVLIDFNYELLFRFFEEKQLVIHSVQDFVERTRLTAYETGQISNDEYIDNLAQLFDVPVNPETLRQKWVQIFEPIDEMLEWAALLKEHYGVFLLSNTSALHWEYLISEYELDQVGHGMLASFEVGALKPDKAIFRAAEQRFALLPGETLFIDDLHENVRGAISSGWQGFHHTRIQDTKKQVNTILGLL